MKKKIYSLATFAILLIGYSEGFAQKDNVGIGTTKPDQSAILDLSSTSKGLLMPRLSLQQRNLIVTPAKGLIVYQTDFLSGFYFYDGDKWAPLGSTAEKSIADANNWGLTGNAASATDFLGTTNTQPLRIKVLNVGSGLIDHDFALRNTFWGYQTGLNNTSTGVRNVAVGYQAFRGGVGQNGDDNVAIGVSTLANNTTGGGNLALGTFSLQTNTTGGYNVAIGASALNFTQTGSSNVGIGRQAGYGSAANGASNNTYIGTQAGFSSAGSGNLFLGNQAGYNETGSNKLYLANSTTANPLIKGEFDNKNLKINLGSTKSSTVGFLAVGNFDASFQMPGANSSPVQANSYRLIVQDGIITEKIKVAVKGTADWADYVFEPSYNLMPLDKVESFVKENKHLPNVPSAEDMSKNGLDVTQTSAKLMEKIEELTLYIIEMNKEIKALKVDNEALKTKK